MELESQVRVYNEALGVKGAKGRLISVNKVGFYEVALEVKERYYEAMLPVGGTVILSAEPLAESERVEVERF